MYVVGVIAEYNPFHNGHAYQIDCIRKQYPGAAIVACMSGSFTQRGEAAILDKWHRAELAIAGGVDLVIELPFAFACRSAQDFARGGVSLLAALGCVDALAFGAECRDIKLLKRIADTIDRPSTQRKLHERLTTGISYAAALSTVLIAQCSITEKVLAAPNNILAIEYLRALPRYEAKDGKTIQPFLIPRKGSGFHNLTISHLASASAIRHALDRSSIVWADIEQMTTARTLQMLKKYVPEKLADTKRLFRPLLHAIMTHARQMDFSSLYGFREGIENRLIRAAKQSSSLTELLEFMATKRYQTSRIRRLLIYLLLDIKTHTMHAFTKAGPGYARILALNMRGSKLLHACAAHSKCPLITKTTSFLPRDKYCRAEALTVPQKMMLLDTETSWLRSLALPSVTLESDFSHSPRFFKALS